MSFIWEKSPRWRRLVLATRESPPLMLAFTCVCFALPAALGLLTMGATNPAEDAAREALLRQRAGLDGTMLARVRTHATRTVARPRLWQRRCVAARRCGARA